MKLSISLNLSHVRSYSFAARSGITISFVSIFTHVWILENKSRGPLKTRQYVTAETLTFFWPRFHAVFYNSLKINALKNRACPRPAAPSSHGVTLEMLAQSPRFLIKSGKICNFVR